MTSRCVLSRYPSISSAPSPLRLSRSFPSHRGPGGPPRRDPSRLNALLAAHIRNSDPTSALLLFHQMRSDGVPLDSYTFTPLLTACAALPESAPVLGRQLHALMIRAGCDSEPIPATAMLDAYSKCGRLIDAVLMFDDMPVKDAVAWNALLSCYVRERLAGHAISTFRMMGENGIEFTAFTLCAVLKACAISHALRPGKQIHARVAVTGGASLVMGTALVDLYSSCGRVQDAIEVFDRLNCHKDTAIYNSLITGCVQNRLYEEAFSLLGKVKPNETTLTCALSACSDSLNLSYGKQIHCVIIRHGFCYDVILSNALMGMYAKCVKITAAHYVFDQIGVKNVVSWTSIIDTYGSHGHGLDALKLFRKMEEEENNNVLPNEVTFLSVLSACAHSGLVDEGRSCFFSMRDKYSLDPGPEHYTCFIDMLGRAGQIDEAWEVFCDMKVKFNNLTTGICVVMLNACKTSMDLLRGEHVAKLLLELDPGNPGIYVLLSNFYAAVGIWERVEEIRKIMSDRGLKKEVGNSHVAVQARS